MYLTWKAWLIILAVVLLETGLFLLITGIRGKKMDDHPLCRKCRFDLTGKAFDTIHCPECGSDLSDCGRIMRGNRVKSPNRIVVGLLLLGLVLGFTGTAGYMKLRQTNWLLHAPVWYLRKQINSDSVLARQSWDIVNSRLDNRQLPNTSIKLLIEDALMLQADNLRPWWGEAARFIEKCVALDVITTEKWRSFMRGALEHSYFFRTRAQSPHGQDIPVRLINSVARVGDTKLYSYTGQSEILIDDISLKRNIFNGGRLLRPKGNGWMGPVISLKPAQWEMVPVGTHTLTLKLRLYVYEQQSNTYAKLIQSGKFKELEANSDVAYVDEVFKAVIEILPADSTVVHAVTDEKFAMAMQLGVTIPELIFKPQTGYWECNLKFGVLPLSLSHDVILIIEDKRYSIGGCCYLGPSTAAGHQYGLGHTIKEQIGMQPRIIDIRLVPSEKRALEDVDITDYWGGEILIKDVPVTIR